MSRPHAAADARVLTRGEVAAILRVDPQTVTRWAQAGKLRSVRTPGGQPRYSGAEVAALIAGTSSPANPWRRPLAQRPAGPPVPRIRPAPAVTAMPDGQLTEAAMRRVLDRTTGPARIWLALAWSGLLPRHVPHVRAEQLTLDGTAPAVIVRGVRVPLQPLTLAVLAAAELPARGLIAGRTRARPYQESDVKDLCNVMLRRAGAKVTVTKIATRREIRARRAS